MARRTKTPLMTKKHMARQEREQRQTRVIIITTLVVVIIVIGLLGYGLLNEYVLKPIRPVVRVGEDKVNVKDFIDLTNFNGQQVISGYIQNIQFAQMLGYDASYMDNIRQQAESSLDPDTLGNNTLNFIIEDLLIRQEAARRGITISKDELEEEMRSQFSYYPDGTPTPKPTFMVIPTSTLSAFQEALFPPTSTPTSTPAITLTGTVTATVMIPTPTETFTPTATFEPTFTPGASPTPELSATPTETPTPYTEQLYLEEYQRVVKQFQEGKVPEKTLRWIVESGIYRERVREAVLAELDLKPEEEQVWARHILVQDEETAKSVLELLNQGSNFAELAAIYSTDTGTASQGGDLNWFGREKMVPEFESAAYELGIGQISQPIKSSFGFHIIQVLGHEVRSLSETDFNQLQSQKFSEWLETQRQANEVEINEIWREVTPLLELPGGV